LKLNYDPYEDVKDPMPIEYEAEEIIDFELKNATNLIIFHADPSISFDEDLILMNVDAAQNVTISHGILDRSDDLYEIVAASVMPAGKFRLIMKFRTETKLDGFFRSNYQENGTTR
jgi:hypothetical protein